MYFIFVLFYLLNIFSPAVTCVVVNAKVHTKHILFWLASSWLVTRLNFVTFSSFFPLYNLRIHFPTRAPNSEPGSLIGGWICVSFSDWWTAQTHTLPMRASCERPSACFSASFSAHFQRHYGVIFLLWSFVFNISCLNGLWSGENCW